MQDPISQTSYYLESKCKENSLMQGTGFFIKRDEQCYLITNWHNVTAKNPRDGTYLSKACDPDKLVVKIHKDSKIIEFDNLEIVLYGVDGNPNWLEHPEFGNNVDAVGIKVEIPNGLRIFLIEDSIEPMNEDTDVSIKDDVYVIGYPFGIMPGNVFPIWKRASIASEPIVDVDELPKMYIDTASRPGMSGSPVVYKEKRPIMIVDDDPNLKGTKSSNYYMKLVGVYSGRIGANRENLAQLGIVWKSSVIEDIINQK